MGINYSDYLQLNKILNAQSLESEKQNRPTEDEMLFIITHQAYELWFKQIIFEMKQIIVILQANAVKEKDIMKVVAKLERVNKILTLIMGHIDCLETMPPMEFLEFRDLLFGASGFQSAQFRIIENMLGLSKDQRISFGNREYTDDLTEEDRRLVIQSEKKPNLFSLINSWLVRTPFIKNFDFASAYKASINQMFQEQINAIKKRVSDLKTKEAQLLLAEQEREKLIKILNKDYYNALKNNNEVKFDFTAMLGALFIYTFRDKPILSAPFNLLTQLLTVDELLSHWRHRHSQMVLRMIGRRFGTGGSSGADYLQTTIEAHRVFKDLEYINTLLVPRRFRPELPEEINKSLVFVLGE